MNEVPFFLHNYREGMPLASWLGVLAAYRKGVGLPPGHVPSTFLFALVGPRVVGRGSDVSAGLRAIAGSARAPL